MCWANKETKSCGVYNQRENVSMRKHVATEEEEEEKDEKKKMMMIKTKKKKRRR
jgi:hypothetical protein